MNFTKKLPVVAIALLTCQSCMIIPLPIPIPVSSETSPSPSQQSSAPLDCFDSLPDIPIEKIRKTETSEDVEAEADKLAEQGKGQEALDKYSEAYTLYFGELGRATGKALGQGDYSAAAEMNTSVESPEFLFKIGQAFAQTGKHETAIDCFTKSLSEIEPPNDASAYMNRGDAYFNTGDKEKARQDYQESADLFRKYKLPQYRKIALSKLKAAQ